MTRSFVVAAVGLLSLLPPTVSAAPPVPTIRGSVARAAGPALSAASSPDRAALAFRWAPIHRQAVDRSRGNGLEGRADQLTRVDFDGDWNARNSWENAARFRQPAVVYYSVVETASHWFVVYMFFHARDWGDSPFDTEHENDSEGVLLAIARDGSRFGVLKAAVTVAHNDFYSFLPAHSDWSAASESVDGVLELETRDGSRPVTTQEARGHGLRAWRRDAAFDGIVYYPSLATAGVPPDLGARTAPYALVDLFAAGGIWERRSDPELFANFGSFAGDRGGTCGDQGILCTRDAAHAPWGWDDVDDGIVRRGDIATNPVRLVTQYFRVPELLGRAYTHNPYVVKTARL